jgi:hypothetical protein
MATPYLDVTDAAGFAFMTRGIQGPVTMLNLLRFRPVADYSAHPELDPGHPISGREAYDRYAEHTDPFLTASGGEVLFFGDGGPWLIGPADEIWDAALFVSPASKPSSRLTAMRSISQASAIAPPPCSIPGCCP